MANVLITGGAGYVGSVVTGAFLEAGHRVTVLDSLDTGGQGLLGYVSNPRFAFQLGDVRDPRTVRAALSGQDAVLHLAAVVGFDAGALAAATVPDFAFAAVPAFLGAVVDFEAVPAASFAFAVDAADGFAAMISGDLFGKVVFTQLMTL